MVNSSNPSGAPKRKSRRKNRVQETLASWNEQREVGGSVGADVHSHGDQQSASGQNVAIRIGRRLTYVSPDVADIWVYQMSVAGLSFLNEEGNHPAMPSSLNSSAAQTNVVSVGGRRKRAISISPTPDDDDVGTESAASPSKKKARGDPRGSVSPSKVWKVRDMVLAPHQDLPDQGMTLIAELCQPGLATELLRSEAGLMAIFEGPTFQHSSDEIVNSYRELQANERASKQATFTLYLSLIKFAWAVTSSGITENELATRLSISPTNAGRTKRAGISLAGIAAGGSIYALVLLACSGMGISTLKLMPGDLGNRLCHILRFPTKDTPHGQLIIKALIPTINQLREKFPVTFEEVLPGLGGANISCADLRASDNFFNSMLRGTITQERYEPVWATSEPVPLPVAITESPVVFEIKTEYDPSLKENTAISYPQADEDGQEEWSRHERLKTARAYIPSSLEDAREKIQKQLASGKREGGEYVRLTSALLEGRTVKITDKNDQLIGLVCGSMPASLADRLLPYINISFPGELIHDFDCTAGDCPPFMAYHFDWYNRYRLQANGAPNNIHPHSLYTEGNKGVPTSQYLPGTSKEYYDNHPQAQRFQLLSSEVFEWVNKMIGHLLPDTFKILEKSVSKLPLGDSSEYGVFGGAVINLNSRCRAHRDFKDLELCVVLNISQCQGGALVWHEPGIIVEPRNGDFAAFKSSELTHLNEDYVGARASVVFHTDCYLKTWNENFNGWGNNKNFVK